MPKLEVNFLLHTLIINFIFRDGLKVQYDIYRLSFYFIFENVTRIIRGFICNETVYSISNLKREILNFKINYLKSSKESVCVSVTPRNAKFNSHIYRKSWLKENYFPEISYFKGLFIFSQNSREIKITFVFKNFEW